MKRSKVFHGMIDVAGQGSYDVLGLQKNGVDADMVVWEKNKFAYMDYKSLNISRNPFLYPYSLIKILLFTAYAIPKYDIFHFHFSRSFIPFNFDLPLIKMFKKKVFMEYHGDDIRWRYYMKRPKYWPVEEIAEKPHRAIKSSNRIYKYVDGYILHDAELEKHLPGKEKPVFYIPLKIDMDKFIPYYPKKDNNRPVIVHAPSDSLYKGSKYVLDAVEKLKEKYDFEFILVQNMKQSEALEIFKKADIIIDQFFAGTYGVFAVEAMAMGKPVICYISEDMINEFPDELPIQNANIDTLEEKIEQLLINPDLRREIGIQGREYSENYHDYKYVTRALKEVYEGVYLPKTQREAFAYIKTLKEV